MKLGYSTLALLGLDFKSITGYMERLDETSYWEYHCEDEGCLRGWGIGELRKLAKKLGLVINIHAPYVGIRIEPGLNGERILDILLEILNHAVKLESEYIVTHPCKVPELPPGKEKVPEWAWEVNLQILCEFADRCLEHGVAPVIENVYSRGYVVRRVREMASFLKSCSQFRLMLDISHAYLLGELEEFLQSFFGRLYGLHLCNTMGLRDDHLHIDRGVIDWRKVLASLVSRRFDGYVVLEVRDVVEMRESMATLKSFLRDLGRL